MVESAGAELNAHNRPGLTRLHSAAAQGVEATVKVVLDPGADIHLADKGGFVYTAIRVTPGESLSFLIRNADVVRTGKDGKMRVCRALREHGRRKGARQKASEQAISMWNILRTRPGEGNAGLGWLPRALPYASCTGKDPNAIAHIPVM